MLKLVLPVRKAIKGNLKVAEWTDVKDKFGEQVSDKALMRFAVSMALHTY